MKKGNLLLKALPNVKLLVLKQTDTNKYKNIIYYTTLIKKNQKL